NLLIPIISVSVIGGQWFPFTIHYLYSFCVINHWLAFLQSDISLLPIRTTSFLTSAAFHLAFVLDRPNSGDLYIEDLFDGALDIRFCRFAINAKGQNLSCFAVAIFIGRIFFEDYTLFCNDRRFQNVPNTRLTHCRSPPLSLSSRLSSDPAGWQALRSQPSKSEASRDRSDRKYLRRSYWSLSFFQRFGTKAPSSHCQANLRSGFSPVFSSRSSQALQEPQETPLSSDS